MIGRVLLGAAGVALVLSLFLPWFDGVSGWEHWAWADYVLAILAAAMVIAAALPRAGAAHRVLVAVFCALGIAVVLGHGFAPDAPPRSAEEDITDVLGGAYLALAALAAGATGCLATWSRRGGVVLVAAGAAGIVGALLSGWGSEDGTAVFFGSQDGIQIAADYENGFERWRLLDVALLALAAALLAAASGRLPRVVHLALAAAAVAAAACVAFGMRGQLGVDEGIAYGAAKGPLVALLALAAGFAGLAALRPRAPAARAG